MSFQEKPPGITTGRLRTFRASPYREVMKRKTSSGAVLETLACGHILDVSRCDRAFERRCPFCDGRRK